MSCDLRFSGISQRYKVILLYDRCTYEWKMYFPILDIQISVKQTSWRLPVRPDDSEIGFFQSTANQIHSEAISEIQKA